jgi:hypothetical protein
MKKILALLFVLFCAGGQALAQTGEKVTRKISTSPHVVRVGPRTTYLKEGLNTEDVMKALGRPIEVSQREENGAQVVTYVFERGDDRVLIAEFVGGLLVRSRVEARGEGLRAEAVNF